MLTGRRNDYDKCSDVSDLCAVSVGVCVLMIVSTRTKRAKSRLIHSNNLYFSCYRKLKDTCSFKVKCHLCHNCITCFFIVTDTGGILTHFHIIFKYALFIYLLCVIYVTTLSMRLVSIQ